MKITKANLSDKPIIYRMWKDAFAEDDGGSVDHYFSAYYAEDQCWILRDEDMIVSTLQVHKHDMMLMGKRIRISYIVGVVTHPLYRNKGFMRKLLNGVIEILERTDLVTVLQGYTPEIYEPFGFEKVYRRRKYSLDKSMIPLLSAQGITYTADVSEMSALYREFTQHFTGYMLRNEAHFTKAISEIKAMDGKVIYYREGGVLKGYCVFYVHDTHIEIDEMIYLDSVGLLKMMSTLCNSKDRIILYLSQSEDLARILPKAVYSWQEYMSVRINDLALFNQCFGTRVTNAKEGFNSVNKPLWIHDSQ